MKIVLGIGAVVFTCANFGWAGGTYDHDPKVAEELRIRDGLPNFFQKVKAAKKVRVAYIGGSITAAKGWRVKTFEWLEQQCPDVAFEHIDATLSGTGSDFGACRVADNVLAHKPDLLFVEYRVNGGGEYPECGIEGIIRRTWAADPETDICLVYTIGQWMTNQLVAGQQTGYGAQMEELANYYGIPSIDFGVEIADRLKAGKLSFNVKKPEKGKLWFTKDPCHPTDEGHDVYRDIVVRSFEKMKGRSAKPGPHKPPAAMHDDQYSTARFQSIASAKLSGKWEKVDAENDALYTSDRLRTRMMLDDAVKTSEAGASFTMEWDGPILAFTYIPKGKGTVIDVSVDGQAPESFTLDEPKKTKENYTAQSFYLPRQKPGKHRAVFTVGELPEGSEFYAGQFLVLKPGE